MEMFDLSFFTSTLQITNDVYEAVMATQSALPLMDSLFDIFSYDNIAFVEYSVSLPGYTFTKQAFADQIKTLSTCVSSVFARCPHIAFAAGMYEIGSDKFARAVTLEDVRAALPSFPLAFYRIGECTVNTILYQNEWLCCVFRPCKQDLFSVF